MKVRQLKKQLPYFHAYSNSHLNRPLDKYKTGHFK